ncbi:membrane fusion protein, Cu(I)/Ag(I) efflux system [Pricia antarctica]|uniref:Membrane fusion protein, Cu(I)/Ag(I) efflux system n=1 Tax=Pricia antarctica TaxID=641691 RepID=A0A1G7AIZ9_9FLAO|nr:efflux RND transporter periplasmic adaptor subunit [Pricia antarctica]SDE14700.1 membrane fusion protein, Cu(I)/Ag(I) efflux system [Pricia antarctica]
MNKNILYIGIAVVVGLLAGYFIFGSSGNDSMADKDSPNRSDIHDHSGETAEEMWTCSMHPQIMRSEPGDCPICGMELIPVESGGEGMAMNEIKMTKNAMALANIQTTVVGSSTPEADGMIWLSGKITENKDEAATQPAHFDGRVENLFVKSLGEKVSMGQRVATVYSPSLVAAQQELITAYRIKESQPQLYTAVRNKFKNWRIHGEVLDNIERTGKVLEQFPIYSHVSGVVTDITVSEGAHIMDGAPIFKVSNLNSVWAEFDAYENQIAELKKGQRIKIVSNAYPNAAFDATVSFIDPVLNTQTRTVTIRALLNNKEGIFKPGMFVTGKIESKSEDSSKQLNIPASAVLWTGERSLVYLKTNPNEPIFEMREVTLGARNGDTFVVASGLQDGDEIVTNGTFTVDAAAQLQGKKSMMNPGSDEDDKTMSEMRMELSKNTQDVFKKSVPSYLDMKDAFVDGDSKKVSRFAKATLEKIEAVPETELGKMEKSHFSKIKKRLAAIAENDAIENQRDNFVVLNENMVPIVMNIDDMDPKVFIQKCPMANNNRGAFWISADEEIRNPYYGVQMMTCGSIIDSVDHPN